MAPLPNTHRFARSTTGEARRTSRHGVGARPSARSSRAAQRGGALVVVLLLSVVALALGLLSATSARTELRIAHNHVLDLQALNVAEAGLNVAVNRIGNRHVPNDELANNGAGSCTGNGVGNATSGLANMGAARTLANDGLCYRFAAFGGGAEDGYYVRVEDNHDETFGGDAPLADTDKTIRVIAHGKVDTAERIIIANLTFTSQWGVYGILGVALTGGACVDSYTPPWAGTASNNSVVGTNGNITMSGGSCVGGDAIAGGTVSGGSVTGTTTVGAPAQTFAAVPACGSPYSANGGISPSSAYNAATGVFNQGGGGTVTLAPGTYCFASLNLSGGATLQITGQTVINLTGMWNSSGGSLSNTTNNPDNLKINSSYSCSGPTCMRFSGGSGAYMRIYAPRSDVLMSGGSSFFGSVIAQRVTLTGGLTRLHQADAGGGATMSAWHEVQN